MKKPIHDDYEEQTDEYFGYWGCCDPYDASTNAYDEVLIRFGIDPWDFKTRRELDI
jgi:hypothetical protein